MAAIEKKTGKICKECSRSYRGIPDLCPSCFLFRKWIDDFKNLYDLLKIESIRWSDMSNKKWFKQNTKNPGF